MKICIGCRPQDEGCRIDVSQSFFVKCATPYFSADFLIQIMAASLLIIIEGIRCFFGFSYLEVPMTSDPLIIPFSAWLIFPLLWLIYVLPMAIANTRHDRHLTAIWALNLFGGWTIVGWVMALVWSLTDNVRGADIGRPEPLVRKRATARAESARKNAA